MLANHRHLRINKCLHALFSLEPSYHGNVYDEALNVYTNMLWDVWGPIHSHPPSGSISSGYCPTGGPHTSTARAREHASGAEEALYGKCNVQRRPRSGERGRAPTPPQQAPAPGAPTEREYAPTWPSARSCWMAEAYLARARTHKGPAEEWPLARRVARLVGTAVTCDTALSNKALCGKMHL